MVETSDVSPGFEVVASFATGGRTVGTSARHLLGEFAFVRIVVARGAAEIGEVERQNLVGAPAEAGFVAFGAGNGSVGAEKRESGAVVVGDGVGGAVPVLNGVAGFAAIVVQSYGELIVVRIFVAIRTVRERQFVICVLGCGSMATIAGDLDVFSL
jgi:hypothetical protein